MILIYLQTQLSQERLPIPLEKLPLDSLDSFISQWLPLQTVRDGGWRVSFEIFQYSLRNDFIKIPSFCRMWLMQEQKLLLNFFNWKAWLDFSSSKDLNLLISLYLTNFGHDLLHTPPPKFYTRMFEFCLCMVCSLLFICKCNVRCSIKKKVKSRT